MSELYFEVLEIIEKKDIDDIEKLRKLREELVGEIDDVFQEYSDDNFSGEWVS